jgi:hypothetical protein
VSTILKALEKRRIERDARGDPEAILERNAAHRREDSSGPSSADGPRWTVLIAGISFVLALLCVIGTTLVWVNRPSRRADVPLTSEPSAPTPTPAPASPRAVASPEPEKPVETPVVRETVRLRTRPLLRSAPAGEASDVYAAGPQPASPAAAPPPVQVPQPIFILSPEMLRAVGGASDKTTATAAAQTAQDPNAFLRLTGILLDPKKPSALINDEIVRVGDVIQGVKVLAIDKPSSIRVEYRGKQYDLELK